MSVSFGGSQLLSTGNHGCVSSSSDHQANWRGFLVRRNTTTVKVKIARRRIESANAAACESMKLRNRTRSALDFLLRCKNISRILEALVNLGKFKN